jgi:phage gp36-like protein
MPYTSLPLLQQRFGLDELIQRTDKFAPYTGAVVTDVLDRTIADADAEIDGYVGTRYALPLAEPVPAVLVPIACDIARYRLYDDAVPDIVRKRYEDAIARLKDIAAGRLVLGVDPLAPAPAAAGVSVRARGREFSDELLGDY